MVATSDKTPAKGTIGSGNRKPGESTSQAWLKEDSVPIVEFRDVTKRFGDFTAVDNVSLKVYPGEFFALLGPSGCGKSTLLRMLAGFETPTSGTILLDGKDIASTPPNLRPVNMMFQSYALFPHLTVAQNIAFGLKRAGMQKGAVEERTREMLRLVKMEQFSGRKPHQMSGGQRQRVALARSLARNPKLLLLDEPLGALDAKLRESTQFELVNIQEKLGTTFIIVTHDQEEAMTVATRIGVMNHGVLAQVDTPADIYENPKSRFVADFIGDVNLIAAKVGGARKVDGEDCIHFTVDGYKQDFVARSAESLAKGTEAYLAIRPEKITISKSKDTQAANQIEGTVDDIAYVGNLSTYHVRLANGSVIKAQEANRRRISNRQITWEDKVWLSWTAGGGLLLAN
ncbi:MAG: ABC transporter ATP-binding protein [Nitratireductor sp.]|nr:ABC transporter ATP-binding protein [Nitratireductor sp.]